MHTAKVVDIAMMEKCLHGEEAIALGDRGYHKKNRTIDAFQKEGNLSALVNLLMARKRLLQLVDEVRP